VSIGMKGQGSTAWHDPAAAALTGLRTASGKGQRMTSALVVAPRPENVKREVFLSELLEGMSQ
jgi:hypothetical protein